ncbi:MAG: acyl carrier protein [Verrucomicrobia bacterium]|nr:acyl carrier protein [Verrucomicrobiota bacterium]
MSDHKIQIREFIVRHFLFGQDVGLTDSASFLEQGFIDSTGVLELVAFLEKEFKVRVDDSELIPENLDSINGIVGLLKKKRAAS